MSSTYNHTAIAAIAAISTNEASDNIKALVLIGLVLSHIATDAIPHWHWYSFAKIRENIKGALVELGIGLIVLPLTIALVTDVDIWWLGSCVIAVNMFDFLVASGIKFFHDFNHWLHWWEHKYMPEIKKMAWEQLQFLLFFTILAKTIIRHY